jgi:hypothetical protein
MLKRTIKIMTNKIKNHKNTQIILLSINLIKIIMIKMMMIIKNNLIILSLIIDLFFDKLF